jgi:hypothetical protein
LATSSPLVEYLRQNVKPPKSMREHAADMEQVYAKLLPNQEEMAISEAVETGDVLRV